MSRTVESFQVFLDELAVQLRDIPHAHQLAFSAACCERAFPNYAAFSRQEGWGRPEMLRSSLDCVWAHVIDRNFEIVKAQKIEIECKALAPDSDAFPSVAATAAQEAALMITLLVHFSYDLNPNYAVRIATFNRDTIDMYVQIREKLDPTDPELESKITSHPLILAELEKQKADLKRVIGIRSREELQAFADHAKAIGMKNLGL